MEKDIQFMKLAIQLAKKRKGLTHPNPTVGAVIVKDNQIIGKGFHFRAGLPHAEREAIKDAKSKGFDIRGSTMYVTLEPCCHYGKTPPCTEAVIEEGIKRVVVATLDTNPLVAGKGVKILKENGVEVEVGILENQAKEVNEDFFVYISKKRPFVHLKIAQTLDGKIATKTGSSKWITSEKSRRFVHRLRAQATAVMVGKNTVLQDNPYLTVRKIKIERQPYRVIIDKNLEIPTTFNVFNPDTEVFVITSLDTNSSKFDKMKHIKVIKLPVREGKFEIKDILSALYNEGIVHLFVEGGRSLFTQFIQQNLWDKISLFIAPKVIGEDGISAIGQLGVEEISQVKEFKIEKIKRFDRDIYLKISNPSQV